MKRYILGISLLFFAVGVWADRDVYLTETPGYAWFYGCFGTGSGQLLGYWDRHGFSNLYTGPVNGGLAPLNSSGANTNIWTMWATRAGHGGRASNNWGHVDDYVGADDTGTTLYRSTNDPYKVAGRLPHADDCIADFIGLSHHNWTNLNGECNGNINAWAFTYFETSGVRRYNYAPPTSDVQSGLRRYVQYCGYEAEVLCQVGDVYPKTPAGRGFSYYDYMQYIDAGYPVLMQLQVNSYTGTANNNPDIHAILGFGYRQTIANPKNFYYRMGWVSDESGLLNTSWDTFNAVLGGFYLRGVFVLMPAPQIDSISMVSNGMSVSWAGGHSVLTNRLANAAETTHWYVVEGGAVGQPETLVPLAPATTARSVVITNDPASIGVLAVRNLFRVRFQDTNLDSAVIGQITNKFGPTNMLFDIDLEQVRSVTSVSNQHWNLRGLEFTINATNYDLRGNFITNLEILVRTAERGGMRTGTVVDVRYNPLNDLAQTNQIPAITNAGASVLF